MPVASLDAIGLLLGALAFVALLSLWLGGYVLYRRKCVSRARSQTVQAVIANHAGGVHKRIDEIREITEAIQRRHPELFREEFALIHWLQATDEYLCKLRDTALPEGCDPAQDERRRLFERAGRSPAIYQTIAALSAAEQNRPESGCDVPISTPTKNLEPLPL